jgi:cysteine desulfurase
LEALPKAKSVSEKRDAFEARLRNAFPDVTIHGSDALRLPNTSCFSLAGCHGDSIADSLARFGIYVGTGSACSSGALHPPRTLLEMGVAYELAAAAIRVSLSRYSMLEELDYLVARLQEITQDIHRSEDTDTLPDDHAGES